MKLLRYELDGQRNVGVLDGGTVRPLGDDFQSLSHALAHPRAAMDSASKARLELSDVTLACPVEATARVFAVAQNYPNHAQEVSGTGAPPVPVVFIKPTSALVGPGESIELRAVTDFLDYEAEVAVVVGRAGVKLNEAEAGAIISGLTCFNDISARDLQRTKLGGQEIIDWFSAKCLDRSTPVGPWVVTIDELGEEVDDLGLRCWVNGSLVQNDRTSSMVAGIPKILSYISHRVSLLPGDVVATGTPAGVGYSRGVSLKDGDVVEVEVEGVGILRNTIAAAAPSST
jgi:2-keto-4-pentenoate hydratase/2-oxohepta-3-ene-1,7-dioic acid hydratase in catechol pathway